MEHVYDKTSHRYVGELIERTSFRMLVRLSEFSITTTIPFSARDEFVILSEERHQQVVTFRKNLLRLQREAENLHDNLQAASNLWSSPPLDGDLGFDHAVSVSMLHAVRQLRKSTCELLRTPLKARAERSMTDAERDACNQAVSNRTDEGTVTVTVPDRYRGAVICTDKHGFVVRVGDGSTGTAVATLGDVLLFMSPNLSHVEGATLVCRDAQLAPVDYAVASGIVSVYLHTGYVLSSVLPTVREVQKT